MKECIPADNRAFKYNYVILFATGDYFKHIFGDFSKQNNNLKIFEYAFESNTFLQTLFRLHWSYRINRKINLPFKRIWFRKIYKQHFERDLPLCFIYLGGNSIRYDGGLTKYIRKKSSKNRQVLVHFDLISKKCKYDYSIVRNKVDMAVTYDKNEAEKFVIDCHPMNFYTRTLPITEPAAFEYDAYFLGNAKDRMSQIMDVYYKLTGAGLRCHFLLANVPQQQQVNLKGIHYVRSISYEENLSFVQKSKCIVEIGQYGSSANTMRLSEALTYHRKLLTNCAAIKNDPCYIQENMLVFSDAKDIDINFLREPIDYRAFDDRPIDLSVENFLSFIEGILEKKEKS